MTFNLTSTSFGATGTVLNAAEFIRNVTIVQVAGSDDQAQADFDLTPDLDGWTIYGRFRSNHDLADGKQAVIGAGGFPVSVVVPVADVGYTYKETFLSAANLSVGTDYTFLCYAVAPGYTGDHWAGTAGEVYPTGDALVASSEITIAAVAQAPADINPKTLPNLTTGAAAGTLIGTLGADISGCTFSEQTPDLAWAEIASNGQVTVATGQTAPAVGAYTLKARATNGVGSHDEDIAINAVAASGGGTNKAIPIPTVNANSGTSFTSISALESALATLESNFTTTKETTWGIASGDEVVIGVTGTALAFMDLNGYSFPERVTIRGTGTFSDDGWVPSSGAKTDGLKLTNCSNIRIMGIQSEHGSGTRNGLFNSTNCTVVRCCIAGDPGRSVATASDQNGVNELFPCAGTTDCGVIQCAIIGGSARQLGSVTASNPRFRIEGNVFDQPGGDNINNNGGIQADWEVHDNLWPGRATKPDSTHQDPIQNFNNAVPTGWNCTGNVTLARKSFGNDQNAAVQTFFWGSGTAASASTFTDNLMATTNGSIKGAHGSAIAHFNTVFMMTDVENFEASSYNASQGKMTVANADNNIMTKAFAADNPGAGPNGIELLMPDARTVENTTGAGWTLQDTYCSQVLVRDITKGIGMLEPKTGTRAHWDDANPTGAYECCRRLFDATDHDHWKDWGWPVAPLCHNAYDPLNELAGASGTYTSFDANGVYTG